MPTKPMPCASTMRRPRSAAKSATPEARTCSRDWRSNSLQTSQPTNIYTLSLHDALPISEIRLCRRSRCRAPVQCGGQDLPRSRRRRKQGPVRGIGGATACKPVNPPTSTLFPYTTLFRSLKFDYADEADAVRQYNAAAKICREVGDAGSKDLFEGLEEQQPANQSTHQHLHSFPTRRSSDL